MIMRVGYLTDKGRRRTQNEDAILVLEDKGIFILADGVGGNMSGEIASQSSVDTLEKFVQCNPPEFLVGRKEIFNYLRNAVKYVNQYILQLSTTNPDYVGMATTLIFAYLKGNTMYIANIGDSRVYLVHDGAINQITEDHTYVNDLLKMGAITEEEAKKHNRKNIITRAIGENACNDPDCFSFELSEDDKVLICSDGLYDEVNEKAILTNMLKAEDPGECAEELVNMANDHGGNDNISVICIDTMEDE